MMPPAFTKAIYIANGGLVAFGAPIYVGLQFEWMYGAALIPLMVTVSLGMLMVLHDASGGEMQHSMSLGPSYLAVWAILFVGIIVLPILVLPGMVWLWLLPVDVHGYLGAEKAFGLDLQDFDGPHYGGENV